MKFSGFFFCLGGAPPPRNPLQIPLLANENEWHWAISKLDENRRRLSHSHKQCYDVKWCRTELDLPRPKLSKPRAK